MEYLNYTLILFVIYNTGWALYPLNGYRGQQQLLQQDLLQKRIQQLQQQLRLLQQQQGQGQSEKSTHLNIILPKTIIDDFEYIPTVQGYRYSYKLPDGSRREEIGYITGLRMDDYSRLDSKTTDFNAIGVGGRPKIMLKNRKLSPGSLKSLAG